MIAAKDSVLTLEQNLNEFEPQKKLGETVNNISDSTGLAIRLTLAIGNKRIVEVYTPGRYLIEIPFADQFKSQTGEIVSIEFFVDLTYQALKWFLIIVGTSIIITCWSFLIRILQSNELADISKQINLISNEVKKTSQTIDNNEEISPILWSKFNILELFELSQMIDNFVLAIHNMRNTIVHFQVAAEKRKIADRVAHDIRSPLSALMLFKNKTENDPLSREEIHLLKSAIDRIDGIANNILKEHRDSRASGVDNFGIGSAVEELIQEKNLTWKDVHFEFTDHTNHHNITRSRSDFLRALSNILNNSYEAISPLRKLEIHITCTVANNSFEVLVKDNGVGIPQEVQSRILKSEIQSEKSGGTGLGLITSRELLIKNKMNIILVSSNSNGTIFKIFGSL